MSLAESLNQARLPIIDFKTCRQKKFWGDRVRDSMICAGFRDKEDPPAACQVSSRSGGRHCGGEVCSFLFQDVVSLFLPLVIRVTLAGHCSANWAGTAGRCTEW